MSNRKPIHTLHMFFLLLPLSILAGCAGNPQANPLPAEPTSALSEAPITNTLAPTATLSPTSEPTPTIAPSPTNTSAPTATPVSTSTPTVTSAPTSTLAPTATPVPTSTPVPTATPMPTITSEADFYRVNGTSIVDSGNTPILLKGIAMGNMVWSSSYPPANDHNEDSFRELSELGFNSVRFYLNYCFFEDAQAPYTYKETGFDWLDQNIAWAKKYGIRLILNMHIPQGGFQSQGKGLALWQNPENQKRLIALWTEIAGRYADEDAIIGYSLINEPAVPLLNDKSATFAQCPSLMQRITDGIRTYDQNHIIFAERLCAVVDPATGQADWNISINDGLYLLDDQNTAYEFHSYAPYSFTHQNMDWAGTAGKITTYPSTDPIFSDAVSYWTGCSWSTPKEELNDGWVLYESEFASLSEKSNAGCIALMAARTGSNGTVLFDDIVVEEYKDGSFQRIITELNFDNNTTTDDFNYWSEDGSGRYAYSTEGYNGSRCIALSGTTADANISGYRFELREGYEYKVTGKVKYLSADADCSARPRIDHALFGSITYCDYDYLEDVLVPYLEFSKKNQVPIYLGEFGVCVPAWKESTGAGQWVTDMLTLCNKYQLHFNYHAYHDYSFGLYRLPINRSDTQKNEELAELFKRMLK